MMTAPPMTAGNVENAVKNAGKASPFAPPKLRMKSRRGNEDIFITLSFPGLLSGRRFLIRTGA
jgi:hypothetical protein